MKKAAVLCAVPALAFAGCGSSGKKDGATTGATAPSAAPQRAAVKMKGFAFTPARITIRAGGSVTWTNADSTPHTATVQGGPTLDTGSVKQGRSKALVFAQAGTYRYVCGFHPYMHGVVVVQ